MSEDKTKVEIMDGDDTAPAEAEPASSDAPEETGAQEAEAAGESCADAPEADAPACMRVNDNIISTASAPEMRPIALFLFIFVSLPAEGQLNNRIYCVQASPHKRLN